MQKVILKKDLPSGLFGLMTFYWTDEEPAGVAAKSLPEAERVKAFLDWLMEENNYDWNHPAHKETNKWLTENGYSPTPSGNQTT